MGYVAVENLNQGMVLDEDVHDVNTRLLLSKGQKLAQKHIRVLKIWGIVGVHIVGGADNNQTQRPVLDDEKIEKIKTSINLVFKNIDFTHGSIKEIYKCALIHRIKGNLSNSPAMASVCRDGEMAVEADQIRGKIKGIDDKLPETPTIITELNKVIADPLATSNDVAQVVNRSPSLTATLLKIVNSAYYGFPSRIDRISRAVTIIGTKEISGLALGICVMQAFQNIPKEIIDMKAFIRHSLACGLIARILAALNNISETEQLFVSGLLHDIGKLIVYNYYPDHAKAFLCLAESSNTSVYKIEKEIAGMRHPQIAKHILTKWKLPDDLSDNIVFHHNPSSAANPLKAGIVHLADIITHGLGIGSSGERSIPRFDYEVIDNILNSHHSIQMIIRQAVHQLRPMEAIFES